MKIVHVTHSFFPYSYGGRERMVLEWGKCASKKNSVTILTSSDSLFRFEKRKFGEIDVYYLPSLTLDLISSVYRIPLFLFLLLLEKDFDICHVHDFHHFTTLLSVIVCRIKKRPIVLSYHGIYKSNGIISFLTKIYEMIFLKFIVNSVKSIIVPSEFSKKEIIENYKVPRSKVIRIPNFLTFGNLKTRLNFKKKYKLKKYILFVGRFSVEKGLEYLLKSFRLILKRKEGIKLVIIGGKRGYIKIISELIKNFGLEKNVILLSNVSDEEVYSAFKFAELVVIPSIYEPFGIVALEAMYFGKPIVAFRIGGIGEIVKNGLNGILVEERDIEKLSEAISKVLSDGDLRKRFRKNSKMFVKKFESRNFIELINGFYEGVKRSLW